MELLPEADAAVDDDSAPPGAGGLAGLQRRVGYDFARPALLRVALTLGSWANEHADSGWPSNGCLEFFGDAVLDLLAADALWRHFPELAEGELTRLRAALVSERSLVAVALELDLGAYLYLGRGDLKRDGRAHPGTLADAVEAVLGAVFLDARQAHAEGGPEPLGVAAELFDRWLGDQLRGLSPAHGIDPKSRLQHWAQGRYRITPTYVRIGEGSGAGEPKWQAQVELQFPDGTVRVLGSGEGRSLRAAEKAAAIVALHHLGLRHEHGPGDDG
jgi:ribonuclease III